MSSKAKHIGAAVTLELRFVTRETTSIRKAMSDAWESLKVEGKVGPASMEFHGCDMRGVAVTERTIKLHQKNASAIRPIDAATEARRDEETMNRFLAAIEKLEGR